MPKTRKLPELTPTSYAILGLLAVRPWTTYELAKQIERGMQNFWPRASSTLYEDPKKLVAHGLATAKKERTGKRPRTVYTITARGRRALAACGRSRYKGPGWHRASASRPRWAGTRPSRTGGPFWTFSPMAASV